MAEPVRGADAAAERRRALGELRSDVVDCRACPRLVAWREEVAREKRAAYADEDYWGRPVPGFGDPDARIAIVGLAPAAHGANRTGRMFTGDRSGDFLFAALHRTGFANQPTATHRDDGLELDGMWITSPVKCAPPANKPTASERDRCKPFLVRELQLLPVEVVVVLGGFGWTATCQVLDAPRPRPRFGHGASAAFHSPVLDREVTLLGSYHVSQQNTFTKRLTEPMLDDVLRRAASIRSI